jgi:UDP-hydrolysing UDP-N-acetyl-D-glucosamine 2-epimerase
MTAIQVHPSLALQVICAGSHLLKPAETIREVAARFDVAFTVPMQVEGDVGRIADARALGRGVGGFVEAFSQLQPDWVLVLGDRIEAFAAASAASIGGWGLVHSHGGDRAEGIADEAMRHAITKLAHLHAAASQESADRIIRMGERPESVLITGSPAIDGLDELRALDDAAAREMGDPDVLLLLHPTGRSVEEEEQEAREVIEGIRMDSVMRVLALEPNFDPGRDGVMRAIAASGLKTISHLERKTFVGLLRRVRVLVGNSSAGLIEAAAVGCPVVNVGRRQAGRLCPENVVSVDPVTRRAVNRAIRQAEQLGGSGPFRHPYGDGCAGGRIADLLAKIDPHDGAVLRKRNSY